MAEQVLPSPPQPRKYYRAERRGSLDSRGYIPVQRRPPRGTSPQKPALPGLAPKPVSTSPLGVPPARRGGAKAHRLHRATVICVATTRRDQGETCPPAHIPCAVDGAWANPWVSPRRGPCIGFPVMPWRACHPLLASLCRFFRPMAGHGVNSILSEPPPAALGPLGGGFPFSCGGAGLSTPPRHFFR